MSTSGQEALSLTRCMCRALILLGALGTRPVPTVTGSNNSQLELSFLHQANPGAPRSSFPQPRPDQSATERHVLPAPGEGFSDVSAGWLLNALISFPCKEAQGKGSPGPFFAPVKF